MKLLSTPCSRHFTFKDFIECGDTRDRLDLANLPDQSNTWEAISKLASQILDPVTDQFGKVELTYGFCSHSLGLNILKNPQPRIAPNLDQHAGYELNSKGKRICARGGMACDFIVSGKSSFEVACWLVTNCPFDRLYFYGADRPLHVSYSETPAGEICWMKQQANGRRQPYRYTVEKFLEMMVNHDT